VQTEERLLLSRKEQKRKRLFYICKNDKNEDIFLKEKQLLFCQSLSVLCVREDFSTFLSCALSQVKKTALSQVKKLLFFDCSLCFSRSPQKSKICLCVYEKTFRLLCCVCSFSSEETALFRNEDIF
jgi:hypothetical protein